MNSERAREALEYMLWEYQELAGTIEDEEYQDAQEALDYLVEMAWKYEELNK